MSQIITSPRVSGNAGYFRIGNLILDIPPEQIQCHKVINGQEVMPLRFPFTIPIKTGQSRWDVTWTWKAIQNSSGDPLAAWRDVQTLVAMFKVAPFVEVENDHIRQIVNPSTLSTGATSDDVMAFALRQLRVDTHPDLIDTLQITMTMSLFNFRPYSTNFQYDTGAGIPASSALNSPIFNSYLNNWIGTNLNNDPTQHGNDPSPSSTPVDWQNINPGTLTLTGREYIACAVPQTAPTPGGTPAPTAGNSAATGTGDVSIGNQDGFVDNVTISPVAAYNPQIAWWVTAVAIPESSQNYNAVNSTSSSTGLLQWTKAAAIDSMKGSDQYLGTSYIAIAQQQGYLTQSSKGYAWSTGKAVSNPQSSDPSIATYRSWMLNPPAAITGGQTTLQNNMATAWALLKLQANNGDVLKAWEAHRFGQGTVLNGQDVSQDTTWFKKAINSWRASSGNPQAFAPATNNTPTPQPAIPAPTSVVVSGSNANPTISINNTSTPIGTVPLTFQISYLLGQGWIYDYFTESTAFLYKEHQITMASSQSKDQPSCSDIQNIDPQHFIYPNQVSVVFSNNIAQLPLASHQYPAYQHMGPVSTLVSIGLLSVADIQPATDIYPEPQHDGLSFISDMTSMMEEQFQRLRNEWRRVSSIHRMQSITVRHQVLNMLGIRALLTKELTTETIPDSANMVNAQYNAIQYENVFEDLTPFKVNPPAAQIGQQWLTTLRNGSLNQLAGNNSVNALTNLSRLMQESPAQQDAIQLIYQWLVNSPPSAPCPSNAYLVPIPITLTGDQVTLLKNIMNEAGPFDETGGANELALLGPSFANTSPQSFAGQYPFIAQIIQSHSQLNYSDFFMISNGANPQAPDYSALQTLVTQVNQQIVAANAASNPPAESPFNQLFDIYAQYAATYNVSGIHDQMVTAMNTPQLQSQFIQPNAIQTPSAFQVAKDHTCYLDMGIQQLQYGGRDYNPALYFYDTQGEITGQLQAQVTQTVTNTINSAQSFYGATYLDKKEELGLQFNTASFTGNIKNILSLIEPSSYSMSKAFPTFKLFLMEDHSDRTFYCQDDFYSFATVLDMEVIRYRDKPDTAIIQISDLMHLLDQHIYDGTPQGRIEQRLHATYEKPIIPNSNSPLTATGGAGVGSINLVQEDVYSLDNRFTELSPTPAAGDPKFPPRYFALQTGSKIQVRMGFSNDPDKLTPVFTGEVTQIQGDEIVTITAQSYLLELLTPAPDDIRSDGFALDSFINQFFNAIPNATRDLANGYWTNIPHDLYSAVANEAAYGGGAAVGGITIPGLLTPGGGAIDVMSQMLKASPGKHFGFWQYGEEPNPSYNSYTWKAAVGSVLLTLSSSPLHAGATGLESGYDRSYENILTTHIFGPDGTAVADSATSTNRGWAFEKPAAYGDAVYHVPDNIDHVPWTLITDIARRYPEFILAVKQYGFPFSADATLVFANPHDYYASRLPLPGEIEAQQTANSNDTQFFQWWAGSGSNNGRAQFLAFASGVGSAWANVVLVNFDKSIGYTGDSAASMLGEIGTVISGLGIGGMEDLNASQLTDHIDGGGVGTFFAIAGDNGFYQQALSSKTAAVLNIDAQLGGNATIIQAQQALQQIVQNYYNFIKQLSSSSTSAPLNSRMKPVRQYHLVNGDNIIHNGITLNESFYNTVALNNQTVKANALIPSWYTRLLDANNLIVSKENFDAWPQIVNNYAASFLRDEVAKAYRGELVLMGNPDIEPYDVVMMLDPSTGTFGPVEVDSVIQSFNQETGFITIVRPRALVVINEALTAPVSQSVGQMLTQMQGIIDGYGNSHLVAGLNVPVAVESGLVGAAVVGGIAAGPWIAGAALLAGTMGVFWCGQQFQRMYPLGFVPLTRYQRPWIAGVEGWLTTDLLGYLSGKWQYFKSTELEPLIYSFRVARGMQVI